MPAWLLFVLLCLPQSQAPVVRDARAPASTGTASISGRITDKESGRPIPAATVSVEDGHSAEKTATADADGRYEITGLQPGKYALIASPGELRATHLRQAFGGQNPIGPFDPSKPNITLTAGDARAGVDVPLSRALGIEGRVLDSNDEPMAGVAIEVAGSNGGPSGGGYPTFSDDRGEYRLYGLAPGRYRVCATPRIVNVTEGIIASRQVRTCHLASTRQSEAADVLVGPSDTVGIDIRIQSSDAFSLSGIAVDASGAPLDDIPVSAVSSDGHLAIRGLAHDGQFVLKGLLSGQYLVTAGIGDPQEFGEMRRPKREAELGEVIVNMNGDDVTGVALNLQRAWHLPGRVRFDGGNAVSVSRLRIFPAFAALADAWGSMEAAVPVNADLTFELKGLSRRPVVASVDGLPNGWVIKSIRCDGRDVKGLPIDPAYITPESRLEVILTNRVARPSIRVVDDQNQPVTAYQPILMPADVRRVGVGQEQPSRPSDDRVTSLGSILPGEYLVAALSFEDFHTLQQQPDWLKNIAPLAQRVTFVEGREQIVDLRLLSVPPRQ